MRFFISLISMLLCLSLIMAKTCPSICPALWSPVCAEGEINRKTVNCKFSNSCLMSVSGCNRNISKSSLLLKILKFLFIIFWSFFILYYFRLASNCLHCWFIRMLIIVLNDYPKTSQSSTEKVNLRANWLWNWLLKLLWIFRFSFLFWVKACSLKWLCT